MSGSSHSVSRFIAATPAPSVFARENSLIMNARSKRALYAAGTQPRRACANLVGDGFEARLANDHVVRDCRAPSRLLRGSGCRDRGASCILQTTSSWRPTTMPTSTTRSTEASRPVVSTSTSAMSMSCHDTFGREALGEPADVDLEEVRDGPGKWRPVGKQPQPVAERARVKRPASFAPAPRVLQFGLAGIAARLARGRSA